LAADIEHYLQGWPVLARGASARYRLRKFLHRHRVTAGLTLVFITALAVTTVISLRQAHLAVLAEEQAKRQFQETWSLVRSNIFELHDAIERLPGSTLPIWEKTQTIRRKLSRSGSVSKPIGKNCRKSVLWQRKLRVSGGSAPQLGKIGRAVRCVGCRLAGSPTAGSHHPQPAG
jgi:hypothetical protein